MCNSVDQMLTLQGVQEDKKVLLGNSSWARVTNSGSVELRVRAGQNSVVPLRLENVLLVPDLRMNLISVSCLLESGIDVEFKANQEICSFTKEGKTVGQAKKFQNLWVLDMPRWSDGITTQANLAEMGFLAEKGQSLGLWHLRFNHLNEADLKRLANSGAVKGMDLVGGQAVKGRCSGCALGKHHRESFPQIERKETKILELIHSDLIGPLPETIQTKKKWIMVLIDDCSRRSWVYLLASKDEVPETFKRWKKQVEKKSGAEVMDLRTDGGGEYMSREFLDFLSEEGIGKETTTAYSPQSNGVAERFNRTLLEGVRSMLHGSGLSKGFWGEAVLCFNHTANRTPKKALKDGMTPYEAFYGVKPGVYHLRPFGCRVSIHTPDQLRRKLDPKSRPGVFLGYSLDKKAYRVWDTQRRQIVDSRDLIFYEDVLVNENLISAHRETVSQDADPTESALDSGERHDQVLTDQVDTREVEEPSPQQTPEVIVEMLSVPGGAEGPVPHQEVIPMIKEGELIKEVEAPPLQLQGPEEDEPVNIGQDQNLQPDSPIQERSGAEMPQLTLRAPEDTHLPESAEAGIESDQDVEDEYDSRPPPRRSVRDTRKPSRFTYRVLGIPEDGDKKEEEPVVNLAESMAFAANLEPETLAEALRGPDRNHWLEAVQKELDSLRKHGTYRVVPLPKGRKPVKCKWVLKIKDLQGGGLKYKARLVAKGFSQKEGIDYKETYAPVIKYKSLRTLLAVANERDMEIHQMDVTTAFLNGDLEEEIYMQPPEGQEDCKPGMVWKLERSLYGLKQSPRCWNTTIHNFLTDQGFTRSLTDYATYTRGARKDQVILALYVDDLLIMGEDLNQVLQVKSALSSRFEMVDFGEVKTVLGMRITRNRTIGVLAVDQKKYAQGVLEKFSMASCKPLNLPMSGDNQLVKAQGAFTEWEKQSMASVPYRSAVGSLMYLMVSTRPDLAAAIGVVSRFLENPGRPHWEAVKRILRYVQHTLDMGLVFKRQGSLEAVGFTDADFAGCLDTRKSTTGWVFLMGGAAISWSSKRQSSVALSTCEAEYMAAAQAAMEAVWHRSFMAELGMGLKTPTWIGCDAQAALQLLKNPVYHDRTKHIAVKVHFVRELMESGQVDFQYLQTEKQVADALTKAVPRLKLEFCRSRMGVLPLVQYFKTVQEANFGRAVSEDEDEEDLC